MSGAEEWTTHHVAGQAGVYPKEAMKILYRYLTGQMMAATAGAVAVLSAIIVLGNKFNRSIYQAKKIAGIFDGYGINIEDDE